VSARGDFSPTWYATFLDSIPAEITQVELGFVERWLPSERFPSILDLCCGSGRHALPLARRGYRVLGVDHNAAAIAKARGEHCDAEFRVHDMRELASLSSIFDGVVNLWHSFGYFDDATNAGVVRQVAQLLRPGGRAIFDVYNREHMERLPPSERGTRAGVEFTTTRRWEGHRLRVTIDYERGGQDEIEWRLYSANELARLCSDAGLETLQRSAWFDESLAPSPEHARMQLVVERVRG
jgi:SAM-dependent methyltransferase